MQKKELQMLQNTTKSNTNKQFMLPFDLLDFEIDTLLNEGKLTRYTNEFFIDARSMSKISLSNALQMSVNWREITKEFLFSVIGGIGQMSHYLSKFNNPPQQLLGVLQNSIRIISDDLSNVFSTLNNVAPNGPDGAHYKWWEMTIHKDLINAAEQTNLKFKMSLLPGVINLLSIMKELSLNRLGAAIQLRVVEAIALEIAISFRVLLSPLKVNNEFIFKTDKDLAWINAHVKAEVEHHKNVKDLSYGMAYAAITPDEQKTFLELIKKYIHAWHVALLEFRALISHSKNYNLYRLTQAGNLNRTENKYADFKKWRCLVCDFIYDEAIGLPNEGILAGTKFEDIPNDWECSDCGVKKTDFEPISA